MKILRRILLILMILFVLAFLVIPVILKLAFPEQRLRELVLPRAEAALGRSVDCARLGVGLGWRGLQLEMDDLSVGADSSGVGLRSMAVHHLNAGLSLLPLLRKELEFGSLRLEEPRVEILLPDNEPGRAGIDDASTHPAIPAALAVAAPDVRVTNGSLIVHGTDGLLMKAGIASAKIASQVSEAGELNLAGELDLDPLEIQRPGLMNATATARLNLDGRLGPEAWELSSGLLGLRALELTLIQAPGTATPGPQDRVWRLEALDMELSGGGGRDLPASLEAGELRLTAKLEARGLELAADRHELGLNALSLPRMQGEIITREGSAGYGIEQRFLLEEPRLSFLLPHTVSEEARSFTPPEPSTGEDRAEPEASALGPGALALLLAPFLGDAELDLRRGRLEFRQEMGPAIECSIPEGRIVSGPGALGGDEALGLRVDGDLDPIRIEESGKLRGQSAARLELGLALETGTLRIKAGSFLMQAMDLETWSATGEKFDVKGHGLGLDFTGALPLDAGKPALEAIESDLKLRLRPVTVESTALSKPIQFQGELAGALRALSLERLHIRSGSSEMTLTGTLSGLAPPTAKLSLVSPGLHVEDFTVIPTADADAQADSAATPPAFLPVAPLPGTLDFDIARLQTSKANFQQVTGRLKSGAEGVILEDFQARLFDGALRGGLQLTPREDGSAHCEGEFDVKGVTAPAFLSAFTPVKQGVTGQLTSRFDFRVDLVPEDKPRNLEMDADVDIMDGIFENPAALKSLATAVGLPPRDRYFLGPVHQKVTLRDDRVFTDDVLLRLEGSELRGDGSTGLDGTLAYRGTWIIDPKTAAALSKDSPLRLLADDQGRISIDFILGGDLKHPRVTLDQGAIEKRLRDKAKKAVEEDGEELLKKGVDKLKKWLDR